MKKEIFTITVHGWLKNNSKHKKGQPHFLLSKTLFNDPKVANLTANQFRFYIYLCTICADFGSESVEVCSRNMRFLQQNLHKSLMSLQEKQLLTIEKNPKINNKISNNNNKKEVEENFEKKKDQISSAQLMENRFNPEIEKIKKLVEHYKFFSLKIRCAMLLEVYKTAENLDSRIKEISQSKNFPEEHAAQKKYIEATICSDIGLRK